MVWWLLVALLVVPLVDIAVLLWLGSIFGWVEIVLLTVLTALLGTLLVRAEGRRTIRKIQRQLGEGTPPTDGLVDGGLLIAAGAFLLTPGVVTDAIGFLLVVPLTRIPVRVALKRYVIVPKLDEKSGGFASGNVYTFGFPDPEGTEDVDPSDFDLGPGSGGTGPGPDGSDDTVDLGSDEYDVDDR